MIKRWEKDTPDNIKRDAWIDFQYFTTLPDDPDGVEKVVYFCEKIDRVVKIFGHHWIRLADGDSYEIVQWLHRMGKMYVDIHLIREEMKKMPLTNWAKVCVSMSFLNAERLVIENTLRLNDVAEK